RGHPRALARQRLAEQPATAADVEHARVAQRDAVGDVAQARRVERVQRLLRSLRVPPAAGEAVELVEFGLRCVVHRLCSMPAMRWRHCRALATMAASSMSTRRRSRSFARPAIQASVTWWRPA